MGLWGSVWAIARSMGCRPPDHAPESDALGLPSHQGVCGEIATEEYRGARQLITTGH